MRSDPDDIPRTYRHGPSDPVVFADGPGTWVDIQMSASVDDVWALVTDIDLPARFSEEFLGASWSSGGPELDASFVGRNQHPAIGEWQTECFVDEFEPGQVFGWAVSDVDNPGARWRFRLRPTDDGCFLRFEVSLGPGPSGTTMAIEAMPEKEARIIGRRLRELHTNMERTVTGMRELLRAKL